VQTRYCITDNSVWRSFRKGQVQKARASASSMLDWARDPDCLTLCLFAFGAMFLHGENYLKSLGLLMCASFAWTHARQPNKLFNCLRPLAPEIRNYLIWVSWALVTGLFVAEGRDLFWNAAPVLAQTAVMVTVAFATMLYRPQASTAVLLAILAGGLVQSVFVVLGIRDGSTTTAKQVLGMTSNPNSLGFCMLWTAISALFFWNSLPRFRIAIRGAILALMVPIGYVIAVSGSRKSLLVFGFILTAWTTFASSARHNIVGIVTRLLALAILLATAYLVVPYVMNDTIVGQRLDKLIASGEDSVQDAAEGNIRYWMYVEGVGLFLDHPIFGVGLNNFGYYFSTGQYSHSDIIEPLATTGLIGFILYQSIYLLLLARAFRLALSTRDELVSFRLKIIIIGVFAIMLIGLGSPHYTSQRVFLLLATFSAITLQLSKRAAVPLKTAPVTSARKRPGWR
jgi:O-antigen ligase